MVIDQVRDIAIVIIAVQSIVIGVLIAVLAFQVWRLVKMVQLEIKPILDDLKETAGTVRGTTSFVSSNVVDPVVKTSGYVAGVRRTVGVMQSELNATMRTFGRNRKRTTPPSTAPEPSQSSSASSSGASSSGASSSAQTDSRTDSQTK